MEVIRAQFEELSATLLGSRDAADPQHLVEVALTAMPHATHAGITLLRPDQGPRTLASTGAVPGHLDRLQHEVGEGPCAAAAGEDGLVLSEDLLSERRWPRFARRCVEEVGVRSMLCVRLSLSQGDRAGLNFYAEQPAAFDDLDVGLCSVLAPFAGLIVQQTLHQTDVVSLREALASSRQIGAAVGILMSRYQVDDQEAFRMLREASMHLNRKVKAVAAEVAYTGELPPSARQLSASEG